MVPAETFTLHNVPILLAAAALLLATLHDIGFRTVPDWLSVCLATDGALLRLLEHQLPMGLVCSFAVFTLAALCWHRGWLGGGDVKLVAATAILVPPALVPQLILAIAVAGGALALVYLVLERVMPAPRLRRRASLLNRVFIVECRRIHRRTSLPYATAISVAALLMLARR
jgi:prepilin peptidase CpaA